MLWLVILVALVVAMEDPLPTFVRNVRRWRMVQRLPLVGTAVMPGRLTPVRLALTVGDPMMVVLGGVALAAVFASKAAKRGAPSVGGAPTSPAPPSSA